MKLIFFFKETHIYIYNMTIKIKRNQRLNQSPKIHESKEINDNKKKPKIKFQV